MTGEIPPQPSTQPQPPETEQTTQPPVLSEAAATLLPEYAKLIMLEEMRGDSNPQGGARAARIQARSLWREATGSQDRDQFSADLAAMDATIAAHGGSLAFLEAQKRDAKKDSAAKAAGSTLVGRLFGRKAE